VGAQQAVVTTYDENLVAFRSAVLVDHELFDPKLVEQTGANIKPLFIMNHL